MKAAAEGLGAEVGTFPLLILAVHSTWMGHSQAHPEASENAKSLWEANDIGLQLRHRGVNLSLTGNPCICSPTRYGCWTTSALECHARALRGWSQATELTGLLLYVELPAKNPECDNSHLLIFSSLFSLENTVTVQNYLRPRLSTDNRFTCHHKWKWREVMGIWLSFSALRRALISKTT